MRVSYASALAALLKSAVIIAQATNDTGVKCPPSAKFSPLSAASFFATMNPGWNLGNTLDAVETEGSWNNPPVVAATFDDVKQAGFKGVRLPVTWAYHSTSTSPSWTLDPTWLTRVSTVLDMITARNLSAIINIHHDSWTWADLTSPATNVTLVEERLAALWYQIGVKLACKSERVAFETINEIPGTNGVHGDVVNRLNGVMLREIARAGGFNKERVVTLVGAGEDAVKTVQWFQRPDWAFTNPWGLQYHYYSPYDFVFQAWGKTTWGSAADKATLEADLAAVRSNFTALPLLIGEWAVSPVATEAAARWRYIDFFLRTAAAHTTPTVLWDNGADFLDRATHRWRDPVALSIARNAVRGIPNALPDSTTDGAGTSQFSSAYLYHRVNDTVVEDVTLPFFFNGNTLRSIGIGLGAKLQLLQRGTDYSVAGESITFTSSFLKTVLGPSSSSSSAPSITGSLANLTLTFDRGAALTVNVMRYGTPTLGVASVVIPARGAASADVLVPIRWAGQQRPAAVKALKSDGTYLVDEWTQYLPPLQQARLTYGNHFDWDAGHVILKAAAVDAVRAGGKTTVFTIEFYPREPGNVVEFTIVV